MKEENESAEQMVRDICRQTRRKSTMMEQIRIVIQEVVILAMYKFS